MKTPATRVELNEEGQLLLKEGEYGKDKNGVWYIRPPRCHMGSLQLHKVVEHEDGTITASPSILIDDGRTRWHGFLEQGFWREC